MLRHRFFVAAALLATTLSLLSDAQQCFRCFGGNWCNNATAPDFHTNVLTVNCPSASNQYHGDNPLISKLLDNLEQVSAGTNLLDDDEETTWGCVTATIHEDHEVHTVRTCLNNAAIICPTVQSVILNPDTNEVTPDIVLDCAGCVGSLCNNHIFIGDETTTSSTNTTPAPTNTTPQSTTTTSITTTTPTTTPDEPQCYRCFGGSWCNNFTDPHFQTNVLTVNCPPTLNLRDHYYGDNPLIARLLDNLEQVSGDGNLLDGVAETTWGCVTATIHEDHEVHTVRTCLNHAAIICPTVQAVILNPDANEVTPDIVLDCAGCVGSLCNDQTFIGDQTTKTTPKPTITTPPSTTTSITTTTPTTTPEQPQCYRCFGGSWCNNFTDPDFQTNVLTVNCPATLNLRDHYYGDNPLIARLLDNLEQVSGDGNLLDGVAETTWGCVTATIHEDHEVHTVRTCLNNAAIICPTIQSVILNPVANEVTPDIVLDCAGCVGSLCNDQTFIGDQTTKTTPEPTITTPSSTTTSLTTTTKPDEPPQCYRCFGGSWCNNFTDPDFQTNVLTVNCPATLNLRDHYYGDNPLIARLLDNLEPVSGDGNLLDGVAETTWGCVTATIHEDHEVHTVRTCLNHAAIICPTVQAVILNPDANEVTPDIVLDCAGCVGSLCNDQTFIGDQTTKTTPKPTITTPPSTTTSITTTTPTTTPEQPQCYRCFGGSWCNNFSDPDFHTNVLTVNCPATLNLRDHYYGDNPLIARLLDNLEQMSGNGNLLDGVAETTWGCVTATIHEDHEVHTVRTCLNHAAIICPTVQAVILNPDANEVTPDIVLDCAGCVGSLCNDQTFIGDQTTKTTPEPTITTPSSTTTSLTTTTKPDEPPQCYRCFGGSWCNNFTDPDFQTNVLRVNCPATLNLRDHYYGDNPLIARLLEHLEPVSGDGDLLDGVAETTWGCVTATIHEDHEVHTVRTCLNNAAIICPTIQSVILNPVANEVTPDIVLDCAGCVGSLCNDQTFIGDQTTKTTPEPTITTPSSTTTSLTTTTKPDEPPQCYRCFGGSWCNNFTHPDFQTNVLTVNCPATLNLRDHYYGDNPLIARLLDNLEPMSGDGNLLDGVAETTWGCVTATIHEDHEVHTVRTCLNNAAIICPTIQSVILNPVANEVTPDIVLDCAGCVGSLCNDQTFIGDQTTKTTPEPTITTPSSTTTSLTTTTKPDEPPQCYRCFGGSWCNNFTDPDFQTNVLTVNCPATLNLRDHYYGDNPLIARLLDNLEQVSEDGNLLDGVAETTWGCVTATIHEDHEVHTVRTCLNHAAIICPTVQAVILNPDANEVTPDIVLDCAGCVGSLCNDQTFIGDQTTKTTPKPTITTPPSTTTSITTTTPTTTPEQPQCYRCFGGSWCNNFTDPDFQTNVLTVNCPATLNLPDHYYGDNPLIARLLDNLEQVSGDGNLLDGVAETTWGCVTATIHEDHDVHTVRTCLNNAAIICPTIQSVILNPVANEVTPDIVLDCAGCVGSLCNDQTFIGDQTIKTTPEPTITTPSSTTTSLTTTTKPDEPPQCYRCFGGSWCNNFSDPDFHTNVLTVNCPATLNLRDHYYGDNPLIARLLDNLEQVSGNGNLLDGVAETTWGCVTATIHEDHEVHTVRTCLNHAAIICPTVQAVILNPDANEVTPDIVLDCAGCVGSLCNDQTFIGDQTTKTTPEPTITTPPSTTTSITTTTPTTTPEQPQCYRCFGGSWCNNFTDPDFQTNVLTVNCPATLNLRDHYYGDNPLIARLLDNLEQVSGDGNLLDGVAETTWGCVTATIHEDHEVHTVRTCLNNAAIICPTIQSVILNPVANEVIPDIVLNCAGCVGSLCNDQTFIGDQTTKTTPEPTITTPSSTTTSLTTTTKPDEPPQCYRCFGGSWCNNFTDPDFQTNVLTVNCPATLNLRDHYYGDNPLIARLLDNLEPVSGDGNLLDGVAETTWGCVTATIHEDHEVHTVRTCLNHAAIICPTIQSVILNPVANEVTPDIVLDCAGCVGSLCNDQTFIGDQTIKTTPEPTITTPSSTTTSLTTTTKPDEPPQCYRCFGGSWCNNFTDPDFQTNVLTVNCPATLNLRDHYYGDNPLIARLLDNLEQVSGDDNLLDGVAETTWGCVAATIHEDHEVHTVRTCLNNAATICPVIKNVILNSDANEVSSDIVLDCAGCVGSLCNDQTLISYKTTTATSLTSTPSSQPATIPSESTLISSTSSKIPSTYSSPPSSSSETTLSTSSSTGDASSTLPPESGSSETTLSHPTSTSSSVSASSSTSSPQPTFWESTQISSFSTGASSTPSPESVLPAVGSVGTTSAGHSLMMWYTLLGLGVLVILALL